jgi:hypothetical protein
MFVHPDLTRAVAKAKGKKGKETNNKSFEVFRNKECGGKLCLIRLFLIMRKLPRS